MNITQKWYHQTFVIVIAFIVFWPVGIYFLVSRNNATKRGMFVGGLSFVQSAVIAVILFIVAFAGIFDLGDTDISLGFSLAYIAGGIALLYYGKSNEKKIARYKQYVNFIVNNNVTSIDAIASATGITYERCRSELDTLITKEVFKNATINDQAHSININKKPIVASAQMVMVNCSGCGASVAVPKGTSCECEYCGNTLKG